MKPIIKENIAKNIVLLVLLGLAFFSIQGDLLSSGLPEDKPSAGSLLVAISIIAVIACFGNFAFTYEKINTKSIFQRLLAHFTTGLLMLVIGLSLIFTSFLASFLIGHAIVVNLMLTVLYIACIFYDFWDLLRIFQR